MKTFKKAFYFPLLFLVLFFSSNLFGETTWVVNGSNTSASTSPSPYENDSDITTTLSISGATELSVTISGEVEDRSWWRGRYYYYDFVEITATDGTYEIYYGTINDTFTVNASSVSLRFYSDGSVVESGVTITITDISPIVPPPVVTTETFTIYQDASVGTLIGTVSASESPTSFTIESGDIDNLFSIDSNGAITTADFLDTNSTNSYDLNISATNDSGTGSAIITIEIVDDIALSTDAINTRDFTNVPILGKNSITINGSILQIGNQILCKNSFDYDTCVDPLTDGNNQNNYHTQYLARIDGTVSHSNTMAKLDMEAGDEVVFARLYWSARIDSASSTEIENGKNIKIKGPSSASYTQLTSLNSKYNWHDSGNNLGDGFFDYAASADVTEYIKTNGAGEYYVGDIQAESGQTGTYASWQLIVVVENTSRSLKNIAIYDGFYSIYSGDSDYPTSITVPASGFITPTGSDPFDANLFIYGGETDNGYGDSSSILKGDGVTWVNLVDGANDTADVMNASVYSSDYTTTGYRSDESGMANPNFRNVLGVDIDKLKINDKDNASLQTLSNSQTSTEIKLESSGDRYSLNMFAFETEVFVPEFCYDYNYKQLGLYFTEDNDGTQSPKLSGDVIVNEPIEMTIFLKSMVDGTIQIQDMTIDVSDINRTQATYIADSTKLAKVGELLATPVTVTAGTTDNEDYINDIDIGLLNQNDYFYLYYSLDPQMSTMDMPISIEATYNLVLDGTSIGYKLKLSEEIPLCSTTGFEYTPAKGLFNVAHNDYYTNTSIDTTNPDGTQYFNIPTQVTKREGNFKVLSMNPENFDELYPQTTIVAVEMIDADAFHYTDASCKEFESSISERVWVIFENNSTSTSFDQAALQSAISNGMTNLTNSADFYEMSRQNVAFRITYNSDENGSIIDLEAIDGASGIKYNVTNFSSLVGNNCLIDMDGNTNNTDTVATYCSNSGTSYASAMDKTELAACMECLYGYDVRFVCSRDNFAIRPEAFMIKLDDQNQTNPTQQLRVADDVSGVVTPSTDQTELAAGYTYQLELNATNHLNNTSSFGYTRIFDSTSDEILKYEWSPTGAPTGCNDDSNVSTNSFHIVNGAIDLNSSVSQVGEYSLNITDTTWTSVDSNPLYMSHHDTDGTYFIPSATPDCVANSSTTQVINSNTKNGCNISSNHDSSGSSLKYRDYNIEFHPYKFLNSIIPSHRENNSTVFDTDTFIYMSDMTQDEEMSFHLNGWIGAVDYNNSTLSNFVDNCYAKPVTITLNKNLADSSVVDYRYNFQNTDPAIVDKNGSINGLAGLINLATNDFNKSNNGNVNTVLNLNFDRNVTDFANPEELTFTTYDINCTTPANCTMNANLNSIHKTEGYRDLNRTDIADTRITLKHYYGRTHASRQRYEEPTGTANIYYEVYCFNNIGGNDCNTLLLQNPTGTLKRTDDIRWFINEEHNITSDGNPGTVIEKDSLVNVTATAVITTTSPNTVDLTYDANGDGIDNESYPYITTMENNASGWLIYNKDNPTATRNQFSVEFLNSGEWTGEQETDVTTKRDANVITNRRTMW